MSKSEEKENTEAANVNALGYFVERLCAQFAPALRPEDATVWWSTKDVIQSVSGLTGFSPTASDVFGAMCAAGFTTGIPPGASAPTLRWMLRKLTE